MKVYRQVDGRYEQKAWSVVSAESPEKVIRARQCFPDVFTLVELSATTRYLYTQWPQAATIKHSNSCSVCWSSVLLSPSTEKVTFGLLKERLEGLKVIVKREHFELNGRQFVTGTLALNENYFSHIFIQ